MTTETPTSERLERVDALVREMFATLALQPIPSRLLSVIDQLDEGRAVERPLRRNHG